MKGRHHLHAEIILKIAAHARDRCLDLQQIVRSCGSQDDDHFWLDHCDLAQNEGSALCRLIWLGLAISGRAAAIDVTNANLLARHPNALDYLRQKLARTPDERKALLIFICTRGFADKHQVRLEISCRMHDLLPAERMQLTASAIADVRMDRLDRLRIFNPRQDLDQLWQVNRIS